MGALSHELRYSDGAVVQHMLHVPDQRPQEPDLISGEGHTPAARGSHFYAPEGGSWESTHHLIAAGNGKPVHGRAPRHSPDTECVLVCLAQAQRAAAGSWSEG